MTVSQLYEALDRRIPVSLRCEWDNDGLMCMPDGNREVKKILFALDVNEIAIEKALSEQVDLIISHHPLIFRPIGALTTSHLTGGKLIRLVQANIAVFSFHTRLDRMTGGVNDLLAEKLGLWDTEPFGDDETPDLGRVGNITEQSVAQFAQTVKERLGVPVIPTVDLGMPVHRVAVVGGDGKDYVKAAGRMGADLYLTGTLSYNSMVDAADMGIQLMEAGHFYTENPVLERLSTWCREEIPDCKAVFCDSNPVTYA